MVKSTPAMQASQHRAGETGKGQADAARRMGDGIAEKARQKKAALPGRQRAAMESNACKRESSNGYLTQA
ncbi:MAG: hypothetical protein ABI648_09870 [Betaproteobacteria bacterium]|jgi:hypothetical protein